MIKNIMKFTREKKLILIAILFFAFSGMPFLALNPAIEKIHAEIFPEYSLTAIQTAINSVNIFSIAGAVFFTVIKQRNLMTKTLGLALGLGLIGLTGIVSLFLHTAFWHLYLFAGLIGFGLGINTIAGVSIIMMDFTEKEIVSVTGIQAVFVNLGGIILSIVGGLLAAKVWYGGYIIMIIMLFFSAYCFITFRKTMFNAGARAEKQGKMSPIPGKVFYYGVIMLLVMLLYSVCGSNLSTHIAMLELGGTSLAGVVNSMCMVGGIIGALTFAPVVKKFGEYTSCCSMAVMGLGFTIINLFPHSVVMLIIGATMCGTSMGIVPPQLIGSVAKLTDESNSALVSLIVNCICSAVGCQFSPAIMTNITTALGGDSTLYRYQFTGICCFVVAVILFFTTKAWAKKEAK